MSSYDEGARARLAKFRRGVRTINLPLATIEKLDALRATRPGGGRSSRPEVVRQLVDAGYAAALNVVACNEDCAAPSNNSAPRNKTERLQPSADAVTCNVQTAAECQLSSSAVSIAPLTGPPVDATELARNYVPSHVDVEGALLSISGDRVTVQFSRKLERREILKRRGYRWAAAEKMWWIETPTPDVEVDEIRRGLTGCR